MFHAGSSDRTVPLAPLLERAMSAPRGAPAALGGADLLEAAVRAAIPAKGPRRTVAAVARATAAAVLSAHAAPSRRMPAGPGRAADAIGRSVGRSGPSSGSVS